MIAFTVLWKKMNAVGPFHFLVPLGFLPLHLNLQLLHTMPEKENSSQLMDDENDSMFQMQAMSCIQAVRIFYMAIINSHVQPDNLLLVTLEGPDSYLVERSFALFRAAFNLIEKEASLKAHFNSFCHLNWKNLLTPIMVVQKCFLHWNTCSTCKSNTKWYWTSTTSNFTLIDYFVPS